jgi:hypothetical protein
VIVGELFCVFDSDRSPPLDCGNYLRWRASFYGAIGAADLHVGISDCNDFNHFESERKRYDEVFDDP